MNEKRLLAAIQKADKDYTLIEDGDKIAVGLSGGKDSTLLLYALKKYQRIAAKCYRKHFEVIGIHIDLNFGEEDFSPLWDFLNQEGIEHIEEASRIYDILSLYKKNGRIQCSRCSQLKKGAVIKVAKQHSCNKIAFGHHADDAVETLFLNMMYGGKMKSFDPKMFLSREEVTFIRPMVYVWEKDITDLCRELNIPRLKSGCPVDGLTKRQQAKLFLDEMEKQFPGAKENILHALKTPRQAEVWKPNQE